MGFIKSTNKITGALRRVWTYAGTPSSGASGTYDDATAVGDLLVDTTGKKLYMNKGTTASPTWTELAASGAAVSTTVGNMATNGTGTANVIGDDTEAAPTNHVHLLGTHDHSGATKGGTIVIAALGADFFAASATPRATFQADFFDATTVADLFATNSITNAILDDVVVDDAIDNAFIDAKFAASAFAADSVSRAFFAAGIWEAASLASNAVETAKIKDVNVTTAKLAVGVLSADSTGRAKMADGYFTATEVLGKFGTDSFDATACADVFDDNAIPSGKVAWSYGGSGDIVTIVPDASAATGSGAGVARIDHTHAIACATPSGDCAPDSSNTEGSSNSFTRADHIHAMACAAPADGSALAAANAEGSGTDFSRNDHAHKAIVLDDVPIILGTGTDCEIIMSTANAHVSTNDEDLVIALSDLDQSLHITDLAAVATDWNLAATTHPTVYIHSNTTPATDYVSIYHDGTDGIVSSQGGHLKLLATAVELVSFETTKTEFNAGSADVDFTIQSDGIANMFDIDGGLNVLGIGADAAAGAFVTISHPAKTLASATEFASVMITPAGAVTTFADASTYDYLCSLYVAEPNIVDGGDTITLAATIYVKDAPSEGDTYNWAIHVASGASEFQAVTTSGLLTVAAGSSYADQKIDFTTGYIEFGATPAAAGDIRQENNVAAWTARNQAGGGDVAGWKVNATDDYEAAADVNLADNNLYGATAANGDLDMYATINGTETTSYVVAHQMLDCTTAMVATLVKAGAVGDAESSQTDLNGLMAIDSTNNRFYFRYGDGWHYCSQDAGFAFPEWERTCPICGMLIEVGEAVVGVVDSVQEDGARHGLYCHSSCVAGQTEGIALPNVSEYPYAPGESHESAGEKKRKNKK